MGTEIFIRRQQSHTKNQKNKSTISIKY